MMKKFFIAIILAGISSAAIAYSTNIMDGKSVVVVAHWDDEILWMEPLLTTAMKIIHAGPSTSNTRDVAAKKVLGFSGQPPYSRQIPMQYVFGVISDQQHLTEAQDANRCNRDTVKYSYSNTYNALKPLLLQAKQQGAVRIITHNPWGEYGHPNHRNVSAVVRNLATTELHMDVWHPAIVKTGQGRPVGSGSVYLNADFLNGVSYYNNQETSDQFGKARALYMATYYPVIYPYVSQPNTLSAWTWNTGGSDYPTGKYSYWRIVKHTVSTGITENILSTNPVLLDQVSKIRGDLPWPPGDQVKAQYVAPITYTCP